MKFQKSIYNISDKTKRINSEIEDNSSNSNFEYISTKNSYLNKSKKENENENNIKETQIDKENKTNININKNSSIIDEISNNSCVEKDSSLVNISYTKPKESNNIDMNDLDFNPNIINNNNINTNDDNFFNISFYNKNNNEIINKNNYNNNIENINNLADNKNINSKIENNIKIINQKSPKINNEESLSNFHNSEQSDNIKQQPSIFSFENSNTNFRKRNRHHKHFKVRPGDWICPICSNINFAFRIKCNRCGLSKEIQNNNNNLQNNENNLDNQRPILFNNININYIFNSYFPFNNINIVYRPIFISSNTINNYFGNYNNYQIYNPCNANIK